jgi:hypothetical protein
LDCPTQTSCAVAMRASAALSKTVEANELSSLLIAECKKLKIKVSKTGSLEAFREAIKTLTQERKKAESVLLDEIEHDVA